MSDVEQSTPDPAIRDALRDLWPLFVDARSLCVYLPRDAVGWTRFAPGPFYEQEAPYAYVELKAPMTREALAAHNQIAAWTNQNFPIRLWAILESHGFTKPIRDSAQHADTVRFLKKLRQHFAHGSGAYDSSKKRHAELQSELLRLFDVHPGHDPLPLNIESVLQPMYERCVRYVEDVLAAM